MGNFAENLNLGNRFRPPLLRSSMNPPLESTFRQAVKHRLQLKIEL